MTKTLQAGRGNRARVVGAALVATALLGAACSSGGENSAPDADAGPDPGPRPADARVDPSTPAVPDAAPTTAPAWLAAEAAGAATTHEMSERSFDLAVPGLDQSAVARFDAGDALFRQSFRPDEGLGPDFNADACVSCHVRNGRQAVALHDGWIAFGPVVHVSLPGADADTAPFELPGYGTRLQTYALRGDAEAQVNLLWQVTTGTYPDGTPFELSAPVVSVVGREGMLPVGSELSLRIPPQVAGPGLLEFVPEADVVGAADPDDQDGDGISGKAQWVVDVAGARRLGRHGWKAENPDLIHQTAGAFAEDLGLGSGLAPVEGAVELADTDLDDVVFYLESLAVPAGRGTDDPEVVRGAVAFETVGCASCHAPTQRTQAPAIPDLDGLTLHPFTDLLLHDMGPGLADDRPVFAASGTEWRTAPLWGIGLLPVVNGHLSLLHDGRARSIEEAILWHGGEAQASVDAFMALDAADRAALIRFVESR